MFISKKTLVILVVVIIMGIKNYLITLLTDKL